MNRLKELPAGDYFGAKVVCATQRVSIWLNFGPPTTFLCHIWLNFGTFLCDSRAVINCPDLSFADGFDFPVILTLEQEGSV